MRHHFRLHAATATAVAQDHWVVAVTAAQTGDAMVALVADVTVAIAAVQMVIAMRVLAVTVDATHTIVAAGVAPTVRAVE